MKEISELYKSVKKTKYKEAFINYISQRINETVSRNKQRFPENFCFQLTEEEVKNLKMQSTILNLDHENNWSQIATSSKNENSKHSGKKYYHMFLQNKELLC